MQVDSATVLMLSEEGLKTFLPRFGDRVALLNFCKRQNSGTKKSLIEKLKAKINTITDRGQKQKCDGGPRKRKQTRKIELGWVCLDPKDKIFKQVKTKYGGGTRRISVDRDLKCGSLVQKAKELFFPNGLSTKGPIDHFTVELFDYKSHKCDFDLTVDEMYNISALTTLRFYLATSYKEGFLANNDEDHYIPATVTRASEQETDEDTDSEQYLRRSTRLQNREESAAHFVENYVPVSIVLGKFCKNPHFISINKKII